MRVTEEQYGPFRLKTPVGIMNDTSAGGKANLVKILTAVNPRSVPVSIELKNIKAFQLQFAVKVLKWPDLLLFHLQM